jgi:ribosomal 50S subunit-recycling heat shock protein
MSTQNSVVANVVDSGKVRLSGDAINPISKVKTGGAALSLIGAVADKGKVKIGGASLSLTKPAKNRR